MKNNNIFSLAFLLFIIIRSSSLLAMDRTDNQEEAGIIALPTELKLMVLKKLPLQDIVQVEQVSREFYVLSNDDEIWKDFFYQWKGTQIPEKTYKEALRLHIYESSVHFNLSYRPQARARTTYNEADYSILLKTSRKQEFQLKFSSRSRIDHHKIGSLMIQQQDRPVLISLNFNNLATVYIALTQDILWNSNQKRLKEINFICARISPCHSPEFHFIYSG